MERLAGTEKQVAWAEDIRERYSLVAEKLEEAVAILADMRMETVMVMGQDLFGNETETTADAFVVPLDREYESWMREAYEFWPTHEKAGQVRKQELYEFEQLPKASTPREDWQAERARQFRYYSAILDNLRQALAMEGAARYWIDRRR